jgi:hypothetical protein
MRSRCSVCVCASVCVSVYPLIVARQRLGRNVTSVTNTHATTEDCWTRRFQCAPCVKESRLLILPRPSCIFLVHWVQISVELFQVFLAKSV